MLHFSNLDTNMHVSLGPCTKITQSIAIVMDMTSFMYML